MVDVLQQAKLVLLGEMGSGKTSLVQRYVRGHYYENQVGRFVSLFLCIVNDCCCMIESEGAHGLGSVGQRFWRTFLVSVVL